MKYFVYLLAIIILLGINLGVFNNLQIKGQVPNLLLLLTLYFSLEKKDLDFFFISLVSGLFLDFYSAGFFGAFTLGFLIISLALHFFVTTVVVMELNWKTLSLSLLLCLLLLNIIVWLYGLLAFKFNWLNQYTGFKQFASVFLVSFFYNWLFLYPVYWLFNFLRNLVDDLSVRRRGLVR